MSGQHDAIHAVISKYPDILFGISNIDFSAYKTQYKCALVFAVPHSELLSIKTYKEETFEQIIGAAQNRIDLLLAETADILEKNGIRYYIPPVAQSDEEALAAQFSFKFAAVNAGLGWIGKNGVLITEQYGPRVRLSAILIDYDLPKAKPVTTSSCPNECNICVSACPYSFLTGVQWNINSKRRELIDYTLCNKKRSLYIKTHGRKNACGLCMVSCPIGLNL